MSKYGFESDIQARKQEEKEKEKKRQNTIGNQVSPIIIDILNDFISTYFRESLLVRQWEHAPTHWSAGEPREHYNWGIRSTEYIYPVEAHLWFLSGIELKVEFDFQTQLPQEAATQLAYILYTSTNINTAVIVQDKVHSYPDGYWK